VVGTGSAVSPVTLCLSAQGLGTTDPTIAPPSTVQSFPVSRWAWFYDRCPLGSFISRSEPGRLAQCSDRCLSPPGFPRVPLQRRSRLVDPC
jgi:hypothetical protein